MKRSMILVAVGMLVATAGTALAGDITADIMSAYVWRGQVLTTGAVIQPGFTAETPIGISLNTWGNMPLTDKNDTRGEFDEVDITLAYGLPLEGPVSVEVGVIEYLFPKEGGYKVDLPDGHVEVTEVDLEARDADTREMYASASYDVVLNPSLSVYYDFDAVSGFYATASISEGFELDEDVAAEVGASIGWGSERYNNAYFGVDDNKFNDINIGAAIAYAVSDEVSVGASAAYTFLIESDIKDAAEDSYGNKDAFYGGINLAYEF